MKRKPLLLALFSICFFTACINVGKQKSALKKFDSVKIKKVMDCDCSIRALDVDPQHISFAGSNGKFGYLNTADHSIQYIGTIEHEAKHPEFRGLARTGQFDFIIGVDTPGLVYKINHFGHRKLMYQQGREGTFFDAIAFWNSQEGLIIGDPIDGCMSFLVTRDAGESWNPIPCDQLPPAVEGEAAFAASNSNIKIVGEKTWVITGGKTSRIYFSPDKGKTWKTAPTPMAQDKATTGAYTMDFFGPKMGVLMGGDYTQPENNHKNKALTKDGGRTWELLAEGSDPGYQSDVKFVPNSEGKELVSVGPSGIFYSHDYGESWKKFSSEAFHSIRFLNDYIAYASGDGKIVQLSFQESIID